MPDTAYVDTNTDYLQGHNLTKLTQIAMLNDNWDGYGAEPIPYSTLSRVKHLIHALHVQPEIFPTASGTIQIEYEKDNGESGVPVHWRRCLRGLQVHRQQRRILPLSG